MIKPIIKLGNSAAYVIPQYIMKELDIDIGARFDVTVKRNSIILTLVDSQHKFPSEEELLKGCERNAHLDMIAHMNNQK